MTKVIMSIMCIFLPMFGYAQTISIKAQVVDEKIPDEAARQLEMKLQNALIVNGYSDNGYTERFVMTAKVDVTQKDVTSTNPVRISEKIDITLMVGDVVENKLYASVTLESAGIGTNENKAFINAFRFIKADNPQIQQMLDEAKTKIIDYYTDHCPEIIKRAQGLVKLQRFDEAISSLVSMPNICKECFMQCQQQAAIIYQQKIDTEASVLLEKAKTVWASNQNAQGAGKVADIICQINPQSTSYDKVISLRNIVSANIQSEAKREWDFKMKQYEDNQTFKQGLVDAAKAIGVAWGQHQPSTVYRTVIRQWW